MFWNAEIISGDCTRKHELVTGDNHFGDPDDPKDHDEECPPEVISIEFYIATSKVLNFSG